MDSPLGVRYVQGVTAFPAGIQTVSTWDKDLINQRGTAMGEEVKGLGVSRYPPSKSILTLIMR